MAELATWLPTAGLLKSVARPLKRVSRCEIQKSCESSSRLPDPNSFSQPEAGGEAERVAAFQRYRVIDVPHAFGSAGRGIYRRRKHYYRRREDMTWRLYGNQHSAFWRSDTHKDQQELTPLWQEYAPAPPSHGRFTAGAQGAQQ